jgi:hypothetical protein
MNVSLELSRRITQFVECEIDRVAMELGEVPSEQLIPDFVQGLCFRAADEFHLYRPGPYDYPQWLRWIVEGKLNAMRAKNAGEHASEDT